MVALWSRGLTSSLVLVNAAVALSIALSSAFAPPRTRVARRAFTPHRINALPPQLEGLCDFSSLAIAQETPDVSVQPFADDLSLFDGPILTMVGAAVAVMALLFGFKTLMGSMDDAIEKVLVDFEETMKTKYPQRWDQMEEELEGLEGVDRDVKLYELMDQMQKENPTFMSRVKDKMGER